MYFDRRIFISLMNIVVMARELTHFEKEALHVQKLLMALVVAVGLILFWRGIWESSVSYITPGQSMAIGLGILVVSGVATRIFVLGTRW